MNLDEIDFHELYWWKIYKGVVQRHKLSKDARKELVEERAGAAYECPHCYEPTPLLSKWTIIKNDFTSWVGCRRCWWKIKVRVEQKLLEKQS